MKISLRWHLVTFTIIRMVFNTLQRMVYPFLVVAFGGIRFNLLALLAVKRLEKGYG
jgi:hypothetical protein